MTLTGMVFMLASWTAIIGLFIYCMKRTLKPDDKQPPSDDVSDQSQPYEPDQN